MNTDVNIVNYSIEDFAKSIIEKTTTFTVLKERIISSKLSKDETLSLMNKLNLAEERIRMNLEYDAILFYFLIPSRKLHGFSKKYSFNSDKELAKGFKRKVNQYYIFFILGHFFYL